MSDRLTGQNRGVLAGVLLFALIFRAVYLWQFSHLPDWEQLTVDNWYHHNWAMSIAQGNLWGDTTYFRAPMYAWYLGGLYAAFGATLWTARIFGLFIGISSVLLTYLIARRLAGHRVGIIAAAIQSVYPVLVMFESELLLDPLFMVILQLFVWSLFAWSDRPTARWFFLVAFVGGAAAITRPTILAILPFVLVGAVWKVRQSRATLVSHLAVALLGLTLTVGVVFARNLIVAGDPVLVASQGGINFYIGNHEHSDGLYAVLPEPLGHNWRMQDVNYIAEKETRTSLKPGQISSFWTGKAIAWIRENPLTFVGLTVKRIWFSFANIEIANNRTAAVLVDKIAVVQYNPLCFGLLFTLAAVGCVAAWKTTPAVRWILLGILALTVVNALFFVNSRFRLPLVPLYITLAAIALDSLVSSFGQKRTMFRLCLTGAVAAVLTFAPVFRLPGGISTQDLMSKGLMLYNRGDFAGALGYYREAAAFDSTFPETNLNIGAALLKLGETDSAVVYFEKEISLHPTRSLGYANLAAVRLVQRRLGDARELSIKCLALRPYDPTGWTILIRCATQDTSVSRDSIIRLCQTATTACKNSPDVCFESGSVLDIAGATEFSVEMFQRVIESTGPPLESDDRMFSQGYWQAVAKDRRQRGLAAMSLGAMFGRRGEFAQSAIYSSEAIAIDSALTGAWVNLISAEASLGKHDDAVALLNRAKAKFPDDALIKALASRITR